MQGPGQYHSAAPAAAGGYGQAPQQHGGAPGGESALHADVLAVGTSTWGRSALGASAWGRGLGTDWPKRPSSPAFPSSTGQAAAWCTASVLHPMSGSSAAFLMRLPGQPSSPTEHPSQARSFQIQPMPGTHAASFMPLRTLACCRSHTARSRFGAHLPCRRSTPPSTPPTPTASPPTTRWPTSRAATRRSRWARVKCVHRYEHAPAFHGQPPTRQGFHLMCPVLLTHPACLTFYPVHCRCTRPSTSWSTRASCTRPLTMPTSRPPRPEQQHLQQPCAP